MANDISQTISVSVEDRCGGQHIASTRRGLGLLAIAKKHKLPIEFDCMAADCGICVLRVIDGAENLSLPTAAERDFLAAMRAEPDERLACQTRAFGPCRLKVEF